MPLPPPPTTSSGGSTSGDRIVPPRNMTGPSGYYDLDGNPLAWSQIAGQPLVFDLSGNGYLIDYQPSRREGGQFVPASYGFGRLTQTQLRQYLSGAGVGPAGGGGGGGVADSRNYAAEQAAQNAFEASEAQKARDFAAAQQEMDRQIQRDNQARQEREARLNALLDNIRYLNEIQPDNFRLGIGLNSLNNKSVTPTIAYGNQLQGNINQLQSGGPLPQPAIIPAQGMANTGMAQGGSISMAPSPGVQMGSTRRGVLVGDREINGDEELLVFDVAKPGNIEVIPIMGRAAEGATFNVGQTTPDPQSSYGIFSSIYHPFGITSAGMVPTRATAKRTDLGYIEPRFNTDFAPVAAPAYGAMSEQYFDRLTGMLLPNISTIMPTLRALQYDNPAIFAEVLNAYENATNQAGQPSPLPKEAILGMLDNSALSGRAAGYIGVR